MCIWAHQWQDSWSLRDVLCRETGKLKHVSTNKMMFFFFLVVLLFMDIIYIYIPEPSIVPFISAPPLVRTWILGSYLKSLFVPFIFASFVSCGFEFFLFYTATGLRFGFKRHMLKLHWIGQVWLRWVQVGPLNPLLEMFEKFGDQFVAQKRAKSAQKHKTKQKRENSISGTDWYPGITCTNSWCHFC